VRDKKSSSSKKGGGVKKLLNKNEGIFSYLAIGRAT
jgi:hypothetical protein